LIVYRSLGSVPYTRGATRLAGNGAVSVFIATSVGSGVRITVGHTPDADDAFMFYGMLTGKVPSPGFEVEHVVEDIERLNRRARDCELDVTAVSVHACAHIPGYTILRSGGSFGLGYGPAVVARNAIDKQSLNSCRVAVPGRMTSAFLLLQLIIGKFDHVEMDFDKIPEAVRSGEVDAGLVIHEAQITYQHEGLASILNVGEWWDGATGGLPVPLGINVMRTGMGNDTIRKFDQFLRASIRYGLEHPDDAVEYAMRYGRGNPQPLIDKFVKMYVNPTTVDMGDAGEASIRKMFEMARERGLVPDFDLRIASP
jgi:1,4-dihydroxy-6-naphthoate synthase